LKLEMLADRTFLLRGSPATLFYVDEDAVYIVDPGHGRKRAKQLSRASAELSQGRLRVVVVVTHFHSDHLGVLAEGFESNSVIASSIDAIGVTDPGVRLLLTFGYPLSPDDSMLPFTAPPVEVTSTVRPGERVGPLSTVHLPGHTPGQLGVVTPSGILYAADSLFGEVVLQRYTVPYHAEACAALETLYKLRDLATSYEHVVPSHGPPVRGSDAERLVELNIKRVEEALEDLLDAAETPLSLSEAARHLASRYGSPEDPGMMALVEAATRGLLACLRRRGLVEPVVDRGTLKWRATRS
jgi:glyoxylase-like metal-dependent hydrolase (beta-lactamase superfamily II)